MDDSTIEWKRTRLPDQEPPKTIQRLRHAKGSGRSKRTGTSMNIEPKRRKPRNH